MMQQRRASFRHDESGVAMMLAVVLSAVIATLIVASLTIAQQTDSSTSRGRHFVQSLHVVESGVEQAIAKIQAANGNFSGTFAGATSEGSYSVTVTRLARNNYRVESTGGVRTGRALGSQRKIQVTLAPPAVFKAAMFSYTSVATKNNDIVIGDIWANQSVIIEQGTTVTGGVTSATGYVKLNNGSNVSKDIVSGGFDAASSQAIFISTNATVGGTAKASVTNPPDPITCGGAPQTSYTVKLESGANIAGNVTTWGNVNGPGTVGPPGSSSVNVCSAAPATIPMPVFTYSADNYDTATLHEFGTTSTPSPTALSDFQAYVATQGDRISGTFYINQASPVNQDVRVNLTNVVLTGDTTIVTNTPIFSNGTTDDPPTTDNVVVLASTYKPPTGTSCDVNQDSSECAVHLKSNFATSGKTAVLVYAPFGPVAVKNNALQFGAIYADSIEIKNNQTMTYDPRIERIVGFGPVTLEITKWLELTA